MNPLRHSILQKKNYSAYKKILRFFFFTNKAKYVDTNKDDLLRNTAQYKQKLQQYKKNVNEYSYTTNLIYNNTAMRDTSKQKMQQ